LKPITLNKKNFFSFLRWEVKPVVESEFYLQKIKRGIGIFDSLVVKNSLSSHNVCSRFNPKQHLEPIKVICTYTPKIFVESKWKFHKRKKPWNFYSMHVYFKNFVPLLEIPLSKIIQSYTVIFVDIGITSTSCDQFSMRNPIRKKQIASSLLQFRLCDSS